MPVVGGGGLNRYAAGAKQYGILGSPTRGPVDPMGYKERDANARNKRNALLRLMKAKQSGNYSSPDFMRKVPGRG